MLMDITHDEIAPGTVVIKLAGKVMRGLESEQIVSRVEDCLQKNQRTIIFDMVDVVRIDSTGIGRFIAAYHKIAAAGGDMRMAGATGHLLQAFHVSRLDTVFRFYPDVGEAARV